MFSRLRAVRAILVSNGRDLKSFPGESHTTLDLSYDDQPRKSGTT